MKQSKETIDNKGRPVRVSISPDGNISCAYYLGRDAEGLIKIEDNKEYVEVDGEKRYWGGIIEPLPNDSRIQQLNDFSVMVIKPDGTELSLERAIIHLIECSGGEIILSRNFVYNENLIRRMYPHFFNPQWEQELFDYLMSGSSQCLLVKGKKIHHTLFAIRNDIRHLFGYDKEPRVRNLVHSARKQSDAIRQALLFFTLDEIVDSIGLIH